MLLAKLIDSRFQRNGEAIVDLDQGTFELGIGHR
jgi:hypothetical protein